MTGTLLDIEEVRYGLLNINIMVALQIRELRAERGWSQDELARRAGMHQPTIHALESIPWKHDPTVETLRRIGSAFGVRLTISFEDWGSLVDEFCSTSKINTPLPYDRDPALRERPESTADPGVDRVASEEGD